MVCRWCLSKQEVNRLDFEVWKSLPVYVSAVVVARPLSAVIPVGINVRTLPTLPVVAPVIESRGLWTRQRGDLECL